MYAFNRYRLDVDQTLNDMFGVTWDIGMGLTPTANPAPVVNTAPLEAEFEVPPYVSVPASMLLRDVIYTMNEVFATTAAVIDHQGRIIGWLTQSLLIGLFESDADQALRSPCYALVSDGKTGIAA